MQEEWKVINECPGYSVSNLGRVRNDKTGRILKPVKSGSRRTYYQVMLSRGKHFQVHRLVATAFCPNPDNKPVVNHLDGNGFNNCASNLECCSQKENLTHAREVLHRNILYPPKKVIRIEDGKVFDSIYEAANACGLKDPTALTHCLRGRNHTSGGYHWRYYEESCQ